MQLLNSIKNTLTGERIFNFEELALQLFKFQAQEVPVYNEFLQSLKSDPGKISTINEIPFLPVSFFKSHKVTVNNLKTETFFCSSGTTGINRSTHYLADPELYKINAEKIFSKTYHSFDESIVLAFLPSYLENPNSSLIFMISHFVNLTKDPVSGIVEKAEDVIARINKAKTTGKQIILFGVTYALLDFAEKGLNLEDVIVIETGGMKGRRKEVTREELHQILKSGLNVKEIHSEYGMTELLSQAYSKGNGIFSAPDTMKVFTREVNDPFNDNTGLRTGVLKIIDLANIYSCAFIETEDLAEIDSTGNFRVLGRMDNSEIRGCNLMYQQD